jgi:hypothetical protein
MAKAAHVQTEDRGFVMKTMTFTGKSSLGMLLYLAGLLSLLAPMARAQDTTATYPPESSGAQSEKDPPTRVARISFVEGSVSLQPGGQGDWGSAAKNRPVTIGDKLWADKDSRAELQAGTASIHLGSMTALSFLNLDQGITQMRLAEGSINFRVSELREGDLYEVDAPNLAFTVKQAGAFRIDVNESGDSARVTVIRGEGEVTGGGKTYDVHLGERAEFTGTDNIQYNIDKAPGPDGLDRWAAERDLKEDNSVSGRYVSRDTPGYSDLDDYGDWRDEPEYGHVWYPREVAPDWAPYSYGNWNWVGPWGWTWVDYSPWGFAPYHYGRWNYFAGGWGWCPGPIYGPPIYGPAFVGFLGGGFGVGVGWFPLGYGEPFYPWFHCRHEFVERINVRNTYIRNTNVFNNTNIHNVNYVNAHNIHAVTAVDRKVFVNGQAVNRGGVHLTPAALKGAQVTNSVGIKPVPHSALGSVNIRSHVATPPASVQNRAVVARTAPAQAASHAPVHTVNARSLTAGRVGNSPVNSTVNRPANGAMNQHTATPSAPAHNSPTMNSPANRPANGAMNQHTATPNAPAHNAPAMNGQPTNSPNNSAVSPRQRELSQNRPPSAMPNAARTPNSPMSSNTPSPRASNSPRTWAAQGNTTDRGRAPAGFGSSNRPANEPTQIARADANRPPWARSNAPSGAASGQASRPSAPNNNNSRPSYSNNGRSYNPPSQQTQRDTPAYNSNRGSSQPRSYAPPQQTQRDTPAYNGNRGSSQPRSYAPPQQTQRDTPAYNGNRGSSQPRAYNPPPSRSYSAPSSPRTYSAPSRSYPAPSRSYSAPSQSYSGGGGGGGGSRGSGGSPHSSGGGGGSHGSSGGGSSHSGGGSSSHGHR